MPALICFLVIAAVADSPTIESAFRRDGVKGVVVAAKTIEKQQGAAEAVRLLAKCLHDKDLDLAAAAAHALGSMGDGGKRAMPDLIDALIREGNGELATKLDQLGSGDIPLWLAEAAMRGDESTADADLALDLIDHDDARLVPICEKGLASPNRDIQWHAIARLGELGPKAAHAWQALVRIIEAEPKSRPARDEEGFTANQIRGQAAFALGGIGVHPDETVHILIKMLGHKDREIRIWAALGLGEMGDKARSAIPALVVRLSDDEMSCRPFGCMSYDMPVNTAGAGLVDIGDAAVPAVIAALESPDARARRYAAEALMYFKTNGAPPGAEPARMAAVAPLLRRLHDPDALVRAQSAVALVRILPDAKKLVPEIVPLTRDRESVVRENAASMLGDLKPPDAAAVAPLMRLLDDREAAVRRAALLSLERIASKRDLAAAIKRLRNDPDKSVREAVKEVEARAAGAPAPISDFHIPEITASGWRDGCDTVALRSDDAPGPAARSWPAVG